MFQESDSERLNGNALILVITGLVGTCLMIWGGVAAAAGGSLIGGGLIGRVLISYGIGLVLALIMRASIVFVGRLLLRLSGAAGGDENARGWSHVEALVAQGRITDAAAAYRRALAEVPHDIGAHRRLADLYAGPLADPRRAATHYEAVRRYAAPVRGKPADAERYAMQRLVDLYEGPLGDRTRALACLEQIAERFADTADGQAAARLQAEWRAERTA